LAEAISSRSWLDPPLKKRKLSLDFPTIAHFNAGSSEKEKPYFGGLEINILKGLNDLFEDLETKTYKNSVSG